MAYKKWKKTMEFNDPQYDSDKDLTLAEQKKIRNSKNQDRIREETWDTKDFWKKTKKFLKKGVYGDMQDLKRKEREEKKNEG